jgi:endonuclease/exonuclease/phosphatase family metal-dependent hydrolase
MVELLLLDSARELAEARRFRARIMAETLAENGAELAALQIVSNERSEGKAEDWQGTLVARMAKNPDGQFDIVSEGQTTGLTEARTKVLVRGRVVGGSVRIQYTVHTY